MATSPQPSTGSTRTKTVRTRLRLHRVRSYRFAADEVGWVTLAGSGIAFTTTKHNLQSDQVEAVDVMRPGDRRPAVIFTGTTGGRIEGLAAGKDFLVWTSEATAPDDPTVSIPWTMYAYDLHSGQTRVVASDKAGSPLPPWALMHGDRIAWATYQGFDSTLSDVFVTDLRRGSTRKVLPDAATGQIAFNGGALVYNKAVVAPRNSSDLGKADLFKLDLTTGATTRLTRTGDVELPTISGRWLAWQAGHRLGMLNLQDRIVHRLHAAVDGGFLTAGPGFAAYMGVGNAGLMLVRLAPGARPVEIDHHVDALCVPCGLDVSGRRLVWTLNPGAIMSRRYVVHIAEVTG